MKNFLVAILALMLLLVPTFSLADSETPTGGSVSVQGRAVITVEPDQAAISFGVELTEAEAQTAQRKVNEIVNAAVKAVTGLGINEKSIQTQSVNIYREYNYTDNGREDAGFNASTTLTVNLDDISLAGSVIDAALGAGANNVNNIAFSSSKQSEHYDHALATAVENARHKADIIAKAAGSEISGIASISENYSGDMYKATGSVNYSMEASADSVSSTVISAGEIQISADVDVRFNLK